MTCTAELKSPGRCRPTNGSALAATRWPSGRIVHQHGKANKLLTTAISRMTVNRLLRLPNGLSVDSLNNNDTLMVYRDIFDGDYLTSRRPGPPPFTFSCSGCCRWALRSCISCCCAMFTSTPTPMRAACRTHAYFSPTHSPAGRFSFTARTCTSPTTSSRGSRTTGLAGFTAC
jgi:hypothetical protein